MLKTRIITAIVMVAALLGGLFLLPLATVLLLFIAIVAVAAWEWGGLLKADGQTRWIYALSTALPCFLLLPPADTLGPGNVPPLPWLLLWLVALIYWLLCVPLWLRAQWRLQRGLLGWLAGWMVLIPAWSGMAWLYSLGPWTLLAAMALVWVADIAAYFCGRRFGRHKLAPTVSPGKTWEGALGAVLGVWLYAAWLMQRGGLFSQLSWPALIAWFAGLAVLTAVSILGDLFESLIKRQAGVKDSSQLLPGHGGVLDRIDSLTSTLPLVALLSWLGSLGGG